MLSMLALAVLLVPQAMGMSSPFDQRGLIGYGIKLYDPLCANACRYLVQASPIKCADNSTAHGGKPSSHCLATNAPYLQTVAYCMVSHCDDDLPLVDREYWWRSFVISQKPGAPLPNLTYAQSVDSISPDTVDSLRVDEDAYQRAYNSYYSGQHNEFASSRWSIIVTTSCALLPVVLSLLHVLPIPIRTVSWIRAHLVDAPLVQRKVHLPLLGQLTTPSRGQALLVAYIVIINILACSTQLISITPQAWYATNTIAITRFVANRAGIIAISNVPLLILFAGRNNFLMWLTDWSHGTFLLLHRTVAIMCTLEAITHALLYLCLEIYAFSNWPTIAHKPYWICGSLAMLGMCLMVPLAVRRLRNAAYEAFLITHILGALLVVVGVWFHVTLAFGRNYGYELWIEVAFAVWGFDRVFRILRFVRNGARMAVAYKIDDDYLRVDIPHVYAAGHVFLYFPTLTWKVWENHPFSVAAFDARAPTLNEKQDEEDEISIERSRGISLLIRNRDGTTRKIAQRAVQIGGSPLPFRVLVESSYGANPISPRTFRDYPNVVCIGGGVGITALLPLIGERQVKLYWETRSHALVDATKDLLETNNVWERAKIFVNERMSLEQVINTEVEVGPTLVLVSGPGKMMAEARRLVALAGQKGAVVQYIEESFNW